MFNKILIADLAIILLVSVFLLPSLTSGLLDCWDDYYVVKNNRFIRDFKNLPGLFSADYFAASTADGRTASGEETYRPAVTLSYFIDFLLWRKSLAMGTHIQSLLEHILVCWILYIFLRMLKAGRSVSLFSSMIFAVHPLHSETINMVSYREDILCALFFLLALIFYLSYRTASRKKWLVLSSLCLALSLLSKEMGVAFLPVILIISLLDQKKPARLKTAFISYGVITAVYLLVYFNFKNLIEAERGNAGSIGERLPLVFTIPGLYIRQLLTGHPLRLLHLYEPGFRDFFIFAGFAGFLVYLFKKRKNFTVPVIMFASFLVSLGPVLNLIKIDPAVADRYLYLPAIFFIPGVIGLINFRIKEKYKYIGAAFLVLIVLFFGIRFSHRSRLWRDELKFARQLVRESPESSRAWNTCGSVLMSQKNDLVQAETAFHRALELSPGSVNARFNLAGLYTRQNKFKKAAAIYEEIAGLKVNMSEEANYNLGIIYSKTDDVPGAMEAFKRALLINPGFHMARYQYAMLLIKNEEYLQAKNELETIISDSPRFWNAYGMLGLIYEGMGKYKDSERCLRYFISHVSEDNPLYGICGEKLAELKASGIPRERGPGE